MKRAKNAVQCACGATPVLECREDGFVVRCPNTPAWVVNVGHKTEEKAIKYWNDMQEGMDNISRKAMIAQHTGTSYGKFEATRNVQTVDTTKPEDQIVTGQQRRNACVRCGKPLPKTRRKYCWDECASEMNLEKNRVYRRTQYQKRKKSQQM